jgi:hypothetical protein
MQENRGHPLALKKIKTPPLLGRDGPYEEKSDFSLI